MKEADESCRGAVVTSDLSECLDRALKAADAELNRTYLAIQKAVPADDAKAVTQAERLWVQYRDATCTAEYNLYAGGTGGPPARLACLAAETRARERSLRRSFWWRVVKSVG
jgi:uncharacterized protein YecT (DUF1311 family)